jgi:nucleotide-binding universal stress UspA family protein
MSTIVVGLDGSEGCVNALRFAIEEARARGLGIRAVSAWHVPIMAYGAADGTAAFVPGPVGTGEYEKLTAEALTRVLEEVDAKAAGVEVTRVVREGHPAEVLLEEAKPRTCSLSAHAVAEASPASCSVRLASMLRITRAARS